MLATALRQRAQGRRLVDAAAASRAEVASGTPAWAWQPAAAHPRADASPLRSATYSRLNVQGGQL
eukprot:COSAG02_NODE_14809_length_1234_cov_1.156828_1_plen_64_part_10